MAATFSFDVVSDYDRQELVNTIDQVTRDVNSRYDLKDTNTTKDFSLQTFVNYKLTQLGEGEQWSEILCPNKMTPELITQVQNALTKTGHYTGPIDGVVNSSTLHALTQFQIEKKLPGGISHIATLEALGVKY